jgi:hypothetical protein
MRAAAAVVFPPSVMLLLLWMAAYCAIAIGSLSLVTPVSAWTTASTRTSTRTSRATSTRTSTARDIRWCTPPQPRPHTTCLSRAVVVRPLQLQLHASTPADADADERSNDANDEAAAASAAPAPAVSELLVLGDGLGDEMAKLRSKYPTSEADYLAAARARNAAKQASTSHNDNDETSWQQLADEKRKEAGAAGGDFEKDAWEASRLEAGNADSQILIPMMDPEGGKGSSGGSSDDSENPEEPKLLLW